MSSNDAQVILPIELIRHIFSSLSPCHIVRLRQVSKQFRDISHDPILWKEIYATARLPRPHGPFHWHSTRYLERILLKSDLLSKTWTAQPPRVISRKAYRWSLDYANMWCILPGRWCIWMEDNNIYYRDINTGRFQMLYDGVNEDTCLYEAFYSMGVEGERIFLMLKRHFGYPDVFLKFLEFDVNVHGLSERKRWDLFQPDTQEDSGRPASSQQRHRVHEPTPFLAVRGIPDPYPGLVFDLNTRKLYTIPRFTGDDLDEFRSLSPAALESHLNTLIIPTRTHVIVFRVVDRRTDTPGPIPIVIQAFVRPDFPPSEGRCHLRLTHQTYFHAEEMRVFPSSLDGTWCNSFYTTANPSLLRNSTVDPLTKSVNIKLLYSSHSPLPVEQQLFCLDLTLPEHSSTVTDILPIHARQELLLESKWFLRRYTASEDGYARGMLLDFPDDAGPRGVVSMRKFSIDANGEKCIAEFSDPSIIEFPSGIDWDRVEIDGNTGRIHYFNNQPYVHLVTLDIV